MVLNNNFNSYSWIDGIPFYSYDWSIPNSPSASCLVKVSEYDNDSYYDLNDEEFTIQPSVTITSPTENQNIGSLDSFEITWETNFTSNIFNIDYSTDFGNTWINVVNEQEFTTNSYTWDISNINVSNLLLKVTDFISPCKFDINSISLGLIENILLSNSNIDENEPINTNIGAFVAQGNGSGNYSFAFTVGEGDDDNSSFTIVNSDLYSNQVFDYEVETSKNIRISLTDLVTNEVFEKNFIITINDINDTDHPLGDCNGDFIVSILDIVILVDYISGLNPGGFLVENADVNFDNDINVIDIVAIVDIIMGNDLTTNTNSFTSNNYNEADISWNQSSLMIESDTDISGLQLVFENSFDFQLNDLLSDNFEYVSFIKDDKFNILIYSVSEFSLNAGVNIILENLTENQNLIEDESLAVNSNLERINLRFNQSLNIIDEPDSNVRLFPIPASDKINFVFNSSIIITKVEYQIFNNNGQRIFSKTSIPLLNRDNLQVELPPGFYFIKINSTTINGKTYSDFKEIIIK